MTDLPVHLLLFLAIGFAIVLASAFYAEPDDRAALRSLPRRLLVFFVGCGIVAGLVVLFEHTFASIH